MNKPAVTAIIVTRSLELQQGLGALLESLHGMKGITVMRNLPGALRWLEIHKPHLILLDLDLSGKDPRTFLEKVRMLSIGTKRVLLVDDLQDVNWVPQYAEAILLKGVAATAVVNMITNLLSTEGEENE